MEDYKQQEYEIINMQTFTTNKRTHSNHNVGINSQGKYYISNYHNSQVLFCFAGKFEENVHEAKNPSILAYNPLSLLDVKTGINTPFQPIPELNNEIPVSALHILDNNTYAIGHDKNIYIFKESYDLFNNIRITCGIKPKIKTIQTLNPVLSNDNNDIIHTIDSSASHLVAISKQGHITLWQRDKKTVNTSRFKTIQCTEQFFSAIFNQKENLICLGLDNGKLFIIDIINFDNSRIITIFPHSTLEIDFLNSYDDNILACSLKLCKEKDKNKNNKNPFCCKSNKTPIDPTCQECKNKNHETIYDQTLICHATKLNELNEMFKTNLKTLNNRECTHVTFKKNQMPEICNYHKSINRPFSVDNTVISAQELKSMLNNNNTITLEALPILNENLLEESFKKSLKKIDKQILNIQLISPNHLLINIAYKRKKRDYCGTPLYNKVYLSNINQPTTYTYMFSHRHEIENYQPKLHEHRNMLRHLYIIPTKNDDIVILEKNYYQHPVIHKTIQFIKKNNNILPNINKMLNIIKRFFYNNDKRSWFFLTSTLFVLLQIIFHLFNFPPTIIAQQMQLYGFVCSGLLSTCLLRK